MQSRLDTSTVKKELESRQLANLLINNVQQVERTSWNNSKNNTTLCKKKNPHGAINDDKRLLKKKIRWSK